LRTLVSTAHSKGMSVILDWVADHTSWDNPWIADKTWYKQDGSGNIISPPGTTYTDVAALNYNSTDMRKAMIKAMKYWVLEANIDGYRCDYADAVPTDFWSQAIDSLKQTGHKLVLFSEGSRVANLSSGFAMNFGWSVYGAVLNTFGASQADASGIGSANGQDNSSIPLGTYMVHFTDNHDYDNSGAIPLTIYNGKSGSIAAFAVTTYIGGVPLIYSGQEVGVSANQVINQGTSVNWSSNPDLLAAYKKLLSFRNTSNAVKLGTVTLFSNADVVVFERISGAETVLVIANTRNKVINYSLAPGLQNTTWNDAINAGSTVSLQTNLSLQPYAYEVLKN
jgi:glycosidase